MLTDTTLAERFWAKVDTSGDCWLWTASTMEHGPGQLASGVDEHGRYQTLAAPRVAWELERSPIPDGKTVTQTCGNVLCVRPEHLVLVPRRPSVVQRRLAGVGLPDEPPGCSRQHWLLFLAHVKGHHSYAELGTAHGLHAKSVRRIVTAVAEAVLNPPRKPTRSRYGPPEITEQPPGVSDRDWRIYCRYAHDQEPLVSIARDVGLTHQRVSQIVARVRRHGQW